MRTEIVLTRIGRSQSPGGAKVTCLATSNTPRGPSRRLEAVAARRTEEQVVRIQEAKVEKEQEVLRVSGQRLPDSRRVDPRRAGESAQLPYAPGVLSEKDWSFWTRDRLAQALQGAQHWLADGGSITILQMDKVQPHPRSERAVAPPAQALLVGCKRGRMRCVVPRSPSRVILEQS